MPHVGGIGHHQAGHLPVLVPTGLQNDQQLTNDAATVGSVTTLSQSYLVESFTIHAMDYNWNPWLIPYTYDPTLQPVAGSVGIADDDNGRIT